MNLPEETPITNVVADWFIYIRGRFTKRTQEHYRYVIGRFVESLPKEVVSIAQLHNRYIESYISTVISNYTNRTGNGHLTPLKSFHRWLARQYDLPNYGAKVDMLHEDPPGPRQRFLTSEEYQKVLAACNEFHADVIRFIANTGVRATEFAELTWRDISEDAKMLTVRNGKGRKRRYIPLNSICRDILSKYPRESGEQPLGLVKNVRRRNSVTQVVERAAKRAGIGSCGTHALRHYFATELLKHGVPISFVSKLLGHKSIQTTEQIYIHFQPSFLLGVTDCLAENIAPGSELLQQSRRPGRRLPVPGKFGT